MKYVRRAFLVLLLPGLLAAGCSDATQELTVPQPPQQGAEGQQASGDDPAKTPADSSAMQSEIYVRLLISAGNAAGTRADNEPNAGETGDGVEMGTDQENKIKDLTVFMYRDNSDLGINAPPNTPIIHAAYFNTTVTDLSTVETGFLDGSTTIEESIHGGLANGTVVEYQAKFYHGPAFSEDELGKLKILVVANAGDLSKVGPLGTLRDRLVERSVNDDQTIVMTNERDIIVGADGAAYTGIGSKEAPFEYHVDLERLAARIDFDKQNAEADMTDGLHYAVGTVADLYIEQVRIVNGAVEPSYLIKRVAPAIDGAVTYLGDETTEGTPAIPTNYVVEPRSAQKVAENKGIAAFLTARYGDSQLSASLAPATFFSGTTYEVDKTEAQAWKLGYVNENTFAASETCKEFATGLLLKGTYVPKTIYTTADADPSESVVGTKGTTFWRYQPKTGGESLSLYFTTQAAANGYVLAGHPGTITEYPDGVCYYYIWIRHANNNIENTYCPMEYAIVRNNIYRIYVESLTGPGSPNPDPEDPENMKAKIFVRKWREVVHPEIKL